MQPAQPLACTTQPRVACRGVTSGGVCARGDQTPVGWDHCPPLTPHGAMVRTHNTHRIKPSQAEQRRQPTASDRQTVAQTVGGYPHDGSEASSRTPHPSNSIWRPQMLIAVPEDSLSRL
jgi:hypothetical protein